MKHTLPQILSLALLAAMLLPAAIAASMGISITLSGNDIVREDFSIDLSAQGNYSSFEFNTYQKPFKILYDGEYTLAGEDGNYTITFYRPTSAGTTQGQTGLEYSLFYDSLVEKSGARRYFMALFELPSSDTAEISLTLPSYYVLTGNPSAIPKPDTLTTDGKAITLHWSFMGQGQSPSIAVSYESEDRGIIVAITISFIAMVLVGITLATVSHTRRKAKKVLYSALSPEEQAILETLRKGESRQDKIAEHLGYSKSKMSKVIRKLEEKSLIQKEPFFKTNKIKIKK